MGTINDETHLQSRRNFLGNVSIIGMGALGANVLSSKDVSA
jgi:hypothetical protein